MFQKHRLYLSDVAKNRFAVNITVNCVSENGRVAEDVRVVIRVCPISQLPGRFYVNLNTRDKYVSL